MLLDDHRLWYGMIVGSVRADYGCLSSVVDGCSAGAGSWELDECLKLSVHETTDVSS